MLYIIGWNSFFKLKKKKKKLNHSTKRHKVKRKKKKKKRKEKSVESECENKIDLFCDNSFIIGAKDKLVPSSSFSSFYMYYKCTGHKMLLFSATTFVKSIFSTSLFNKGKKIVKSTNHLHFATPHLPNFQCSICFFHWLHISHP